MILSDIDILELLQSGENLIEPFNLSQLNGASYDVTTSDTLSVANKNVQTISLNDDSAVENAYHTIDISADGYSLRPGEYVLVHLSETISIPAGLCAHIRPRTRFTRLGIVLSAQHCNPGYVGKLALGLYNASTNAVVLVPGLKIAQVVFEELKTEASKERQYSNQKNAAYMGETFPRAATFAGAELSEAARTLYNDIMKNLKKD